MIAAENLTFRDAEARDEAFFREIFFADRQEEFFSIPDAQRGPLIEFQYQARQRHYSAAFPGSRMTVAEFEGAPVGYMLTQQSATVHIIDFAVSPAFRGQGVGTALMQRVIKGADGHSLPISLTVKRGNAAQSLYSRSGFEITKDDPREFDIEMVRPPSLDR